MRCPSCGESCKNSAKFCPNCGVSLKAADVAQAAIATSPPTRRPAVAFLISVVAAVGLIAVALSMSFIYDAPGDIGSGIASLFHAVGAVQFMLALGVLVSSMFLMVKGFDVEVWGSVIVALGLVSVAALLLVVAEGTFAVIFLAIPGLLAVVAGYLARRAAAR